MFEWQGPPPALTLW